MASTSASDGDATIRRIRTAASTLTTDNQSLIADIRKAYSMMKEIAVDLERDNETSKEIENAVAELLESCDNFAHQGSAIEAVGNLYRPAEELTDFKKVLEAEFVKIKANSSANPQNHPWMRQFREAVWDVHHAGQPMPGEEHEDIVMTSTQSNLLNITCPVSGKAITELKEPVRSAECKHIYENEAIRIYISSNKPKAKCPIAGCPRFLQVSKLVCDPMLLVEIDEMRQKSKQTSRTNVVEDFTALDEDEDSR